MTNQGFVDWAFPQNVSTEQKLVLLAVAMSAGRDGGGKITLGMHRAVARDQVGM